MGVSATTRTASWGPFERAAILPAWSPVAVVAVAFLAGAELPPPLRYAPLAASVVFGLPHGAVDPFVLPRARDASVGTRSLAFVGALYLLFGCAYAAVWFVAPVAAAVAFVLLTWFHWGQGDLHALVSLVGVDHLRTRPQRVLAVFVRGGFPMLVPLVAFPARYRSVLDGFVALFGSSFALAWPFAPTVRVALGGGFAALTALALAVGYSRATDHRRWGIDAAETGLLWAFFATVPPVVAVGVYFCCWHSVRHVLRAVALDDVAADRLRQGRSLEALARFAREATPLTLAALAVLCGFAVAVPRPPGDLRGLVALYLVVIAVLTLPHVVVVSLLDAAEGIWAGRTRL
jgi:Brp/Blh family beta-carotene 15,15'-monooxygenase